MWTPGGRGSGVLRYSVMTDNKPVKDPKDSSQSRDPKFPIFFDLFMNVIHLQ